MLTRARKRNSLNVRPTCQDASTVHQFKGRLCEKPRNDDQTTSQRALSGCGKKGQRFEKQPRYGEFSFVPGSECIPPKPPIQVPNTLPPAISEHFPRPTWMASLRIVQKCNSKKNAPKKEEHEQKRSPLMLSCPAG